MLHKKRLNTSQFFIINVFLICFVFFLGCGSSKVPKPEEDEVQKEDTFVLNVINDIETKIDGETFTITIKAQHELVFSSVLQSEPLGLVLYFPGATLSMGKKEIFVDNVFVGKITAKELIENGPSKVFIGFRKDAEYKIDNQGKDIVISFNKGIKESGENLAGENLNDEKNRVSMLDGDIDISEASMFKSIEVESAEGCFNINIKADGIIKNYKNFILDKPSRIVFDLYGLKSELKGEQSASVVNNDFIKKIRYFSYPEKMRFVLDTDKDMKESFLSKPISTGLLIQVGNVDNKSSNKIVKTEKAPVKTSYTDYAVINKIDFIGASEGYSTVVIGTTRPVNYKISEVSPQKLELELEQTLIPRSRRRPIITTRFASAVDRILPIVKPGIKNTGFIEMILRESVHYDIIQEDNILEIRFSPSLVASKSVDNELLSSLADNILEEAGRGVDTVWEIEEPGIIESTEKVAADIYEDESYSLSASEENESGDASGVSVLRYTGEKITLDFYETDIKNVLRILRDISGKNFAIDKDVNGSVTLSFIKAVPWDQVLDLVLKMNGLGKTFEGDIIRIATWATLQKEEEYKKAKLTAEQSLKQHKEALEPLITEYIPVSYSSAESDIQPHLTPILTGGRGRISVDSRTNQVIITDVAAKIKQAKCIVKRLDKITPQVVIEARIVEASINFSREIGVNWGAKGQINSKLGGDHADGNQEYSMGINFPASSNAFAGFNFNRIIGTPLSLNAQLMAMESQGKGRIISTPKIVTLDNEKATIKQGIKYPYNKLDDSGNTVTTFEDIDLVLEVTPHVTPDNRVSLDINITKNDIGNIINNQQSFTTKETTTKLLLNDGDTIVIGGVIKETTRDGTAGVPILNKIPLIGWLFKNKTLTDDKEELLIFITPRIVQMENSQ